MSLYFKRRKKEVKVPRARYYNFCPTDKETCGQDHSHRAVRFESELNKYSRVDYLPDSTASRPLWSSQHFFSAINFKTKPKQNKTTKQTEKHKQV